MRIGIHCTDTELRAAIVGGSAKHGVLKKSASEKLGKGVLKQGKIIDSEAFTKALKAVTTTLGGSTVALALPPEAVYCSVLTIKHAGSGGFQAALESALEENIPETSDIRVKTRALERTSAGTLVSVVAVSNDLLNDYATACKKAGIRLTSITTPSLGALAHLSNKGSLLLGIAGTGTSCSLTVVQSGWPTDESVLQEKATDATIAKEAESLLKEFQHLHIRRIATIGSEKLLASLGKSAESPKGKKAKPDIEAAPYVVSAVFPWMNDKDVPFAGACIACLGTGGDMNLLHNGHAKRTALAVLALVAVMAACAAAIVYFRPDLVALWF